jgi:hypothetical protein
VSSYLRVVLQAGFFGDVSWSGDAFLLVPILGLGMTVSKGHTTSRYIDIDDRVGEDGLDAGSEVYLRFFPFSFG